MILLISEQSRHGGHVQMTGAEWRIARSCLPQTVAGLRIDHEIARQLPDAAAFADALPVRVWLGTAALATLSDAVRDA